ncbi:MAG: biopolymer transporter ExbD [Spirochaetes bacterium]|nr:biopolymer transporter ExbD [Spirochaetota bacterium]
MKIARRTRRQSMIPINSMSDIAFLLLIFIMLIALINYRKEVKIEYPEAQYQEVTQADKNFEIWIDVYGNIYFDGSIVDLKTIENLIVDAISEDPSIRIHILADKSTPYKNVSGVLEILKLLQHRVVSFVVKDNSQ